MQMQRTMKESRKTERTLIPPECEAAVWAIGNSSALPFPYIRYGCCGEFRPTMNDKL